MNMLTQRDKRARTLLLAVLIPMLVAVMSLASCKEETSPIEPIDSDVVTTVTLTIPQDGVPVEYVWEDIDGEGVGVPNRIDTIKLAMGSIYSGTIKLENRAKSPAVDITPEIRTYATQHQFFFSANPGFINAAAAEGDTASNGLPLGLKFTIVPTAVTSGTFTISLSHYANASDKDGSTPSSETDVSVTFPAVVFTK